MAKDRIAPENLGELEKNFLLEVRTIKRVDPMFPVTGSSLTRRCRRPGKEIQIALARLHGELDLVGKFVLDPVNIELTALREVVADLLDGRRAPPSE